MAVAAAEAVSAEAGCEVMLKWPNDLVLEGRKLGGVLVEAQIAAGRVSEAVLSIGVNVNISPEDLPEALGPTAISLLAATGRPHDLIAITVRLLEKLEALWPSVTGDGSALAGSWGRRDALAGREVSVSLAGKMRRGRAAGVDRQGRLLLATSLLGRTAIATGEVVSVREGQDEGPPVLAR
jgi:BirA family biotin operon repressor/biotin-[acetyl-CoA-carboxylase] ligase